MRLSLHRPGHMTVIVALAFLYFGAAVAVAEDSNQGPIVQSANSMSTGLIESATAPSPEPRKNASLVTGGSDPGIYLNHDVALRNPDLSAYDVEKKRTNAARLPGLAAIAEHVRAKQESRMHQGGTSSFSLADVLAEALWRKQVVDALHRDPDGILASGPFGE